MTYGWAILVVLIVISALTYFGVANPTAMVRARCTLETGWNCADFVVSSSTGVKLSIFNGLGTGVTITNLTIVPDTASQGISCGFGIANNVTVASGKSAVLVNLTPCSIPAGLTIPANKYRWDIYIRYYPEGSDLSFSKTVRGELYTSVEP